LKSSTRSWMTEPPLNFPLSGYLRALLKLRVPVFLIFGDSYG
jgi:hypothetical protein